MFRMSVKVLNAWEKDLEVVSVNPSTVPSVSYFAEYFCRRQRGTAGDVLTTAEALLPCCVRNGLAQTELASRYRILSFLST